MAATHYEVLGLDCDATTASIAAAYRSRKAALESKSNEAGRVDRRRFGGELAKVENAFVVLATPDTRASYDALLAERSLGEASVPITSEMTLEDFYRDPARSESREIDFGSSWPRDGRGPWKVVWLEATGELVAFNERSGERHLSPGVSSGGGNLLLDLGVEIAADAAIQGLVHLVSDAKATREIRSEVFIITVQPDLGRLNLALAGWERHIREPDGMAWLIERATA